MNRHEDESSRGSVAMKMNRHGVLLRDSIVMGFSCHVCYGGCVFDNVYALICSIAAGEKGHVLYVGKRLYLGHSRTNSNTKYLFIYRLEPRCWYFAFSRVCRKQVRGFVTLVFIKNS